MPSLRTALPVRLRSLWLSFSLGVFSALWSFGAPASDDVSGAALYASALSHLQAEDYPTALVELRQLQRRFPQFRHKAAVHTRIAVLHEARDAGDALAVFLDALDLRDAGQSDKALALLSQMMLDQPGNTLVDDALYLTAYIQVMDRYEYFRAQQTLDRLRSEYPDTAYRDTADYLTAIALEQLGQTQAATEALMALRDRHTALALPFNFRWASGNVLSRYWFDRADRRLDMVRQRVSAASVLRGRDTRSGGVLTVRVNVDGTDLQLQLTPAPLTRTTAWRDGYLDDQLPPSVGVYSGSVAGDDDSWVRVVLAEQSITGVAFAFGQRYELHPDNLVGTLDYYRPLVAERQRRAQLTTVGPGDGLAAPAPALMSPELQQRGIRTQTDLRVVPVSVVIDPQYDRFYAGSGLTRALNDMNIADGFYRQFGLTLSIDEAVVLNDETDPMSNNAQTLESLLRSFRGYRLDRNTLFADSAVTYLFTAKPRTDPTLGLAWIDTLCRTDGYDVGVTTPVAFGDVLFSHEFGHSLGAQHDSDTSCNGDSSKLMWPHISSRTRTELSTCSRESVLESRSRSCLTNAIDIALSVSPAGDAVRFEVINPDSRNSVQATLMVETSAPDVVAWPSECQPVTPTSAACVLEQVAQSQRAALDLPRLSAASDVLLTGHVSVDGIWDPDTSNNVASIAADGSGAQHLPVSVQPQVVLADNGAGNPAAATAGAVHGWAISFLAALAWRRRALRRLTVSR